MMNLKLISLATCRVYALSSCIVFVLNPRREDVAGQHSHCTHPHSQSTLLHGHREPTEYALSAPREHTPTQSARYLHTIYP